MLLREDINGLRAIKLAKAEFEHDHPGCPRCGTRQQSRFAHSCSNCQYKLGGGHN
jgi:tRNA(Ile2) C34 agmatinyltransferase TiaS